MRKLISFLGVVATMLITLAANAEEAPAEDAVSAAPEQVEVPSDAQPGAPALSDEQASPVEVAAEPVASPAPGEEQQQTQDPQLDVLLHQLSSDEPNERIEAILALRTLDDPAVVAPIAEVARTDTEPVVRAQAIWALYRIGTPTALATVSQVASADGDALVRRTAASLLARSDPREARAVAAARRTYRIGVGLSILGALSLATSVVIYSMSFESDLGIPATVLLGVGVGIVVAGIVLAARGRIQLRRAFGVRSWQEARQRLRRANEDELIAREQQASNSSGLPPSEATVVALTRARQQLVGCFEDEGDALGTTLYITLLGGQLSLRDATPFPSRAERECLRESLDRVRVTCMECRIHNLSFQLGDPH